MMASVPARAASGPPETGASMKAMPVRVREDLGLRLGRPDLGGGMIHEHLAVEPAGRDDAVRARDDIFNRGRVDDAHQHDVGLLRDLGRRRRRLDAVGFGVRDLGRVDVEANDAMAGLLEAGGEALPHQAEADEPDRLCHCAPRGFMVSGSIRRLAARRTQESSRCCCSNALSAFASRRSSAAMIAS